MASRREITKKKKGEVIKEAKISALEGEKMNSKKNAGIVILLISMILLVLILVFLYFDWMLDDDGTNHLTAEDFKREYEKFNGKTDSNGNLYMNLSIPSNHVVQYASYQRIFSLLERGTGVIYFGTPQNFQCRNLVPVLLEAAQETGLDTIYYLDISFTRDEKELDSSFEIVTTKEGSTNYQKLLKELDSVLESYDGLEDDSIKRVYFPTVIFVKDGEIVSSFIGTKNENSSDELTEQEENILKTDLIKKMNQVITCDDAC